MRKAGLRILQILIILIVIYMIGPKPDKPILSDQLPTVSASIEQLDQWIADKEGNFNIKPDNQARIVWANDSLKQPTEYVLLYMHGFSASWYEGQSLNVDFGKDFQCNTYLPRLHDHGIVTDDALIDMTPDKLYDSAKEALVVARKLGKKVIIMSTSTGGTLSLKLAAQFPSLVDALILFSPNVAINNSAAPLLSRPWGLNIARLNYGSDYRDKGDTDPIDLQYWNSKYRLEAIVYLQRLMDATMTEETFQQVKCPLFLGYYYRSETLQDDVVKVSAMLEMYDQLSTPEDLKRRIAFPEANAHVIASSHHSKAAKDVKKAVYAFAKETLKMKLAE
ncbi:alpha/beta hydrolase [Puteibacter caeruleilacunae]|nr:alpha/beta hydrolase [Puteibacter caeruleilacunae]